MFFTTSPLLSVREMVIGEKGRFVRPIPIGEAIYLCPAIRILNLTAPCSSLSPENSKTALAPFLHDSHIQVLILRLVKAQDVDVTTATVLAAPRGISQQRTRPDSLGLRPTTQELIDHTSTCRQIGPENIFPAQVAGFTAMEAALRRALAIRASTPAGPIAHWQSIIAAQKNCARLRKSAARR